MRRDARIDHFGKMVVVVQTELALKRSASGKYWRIKSIFSSAAQYFGQTREIAEKLDCVMDGISILSR